MATQQSAHGVQSEAGGAAAHRRVRRLVLLAAAVAAGLAATDAAVDLEAAIRRETVRGDLKVAAESYRKIAARKDAPREVAARALLRLALVYRKQGDTQARATLERVVRDYPDQAKTAEEARSELASITGPAAGSPALRWKGSQRKIGLPFNITADGEALATFLFGPAGRWDAGLFRFKSGQYTSLATPLYSCYPLLASPDGKLVVYGFRESAVPIKFQCNQIQIAGLGLPSPLTIFNGDGRRLTQPLAWMPDSRAVVAVTGAPSEPGQQPNGGGNDLILVDVRTRQTKLLKGNLTPSVPAETSTLGSVAAVSPDGRWVAFSANTSRPRIVATAGGFDEFIDGVLDSDSVTAWSPDSKHLLIQSRRGGMDALYRVAMREGRAAGTPALVLEMRDREVAGVDSRGLLHYGNAQTATDAFTMGFDASEAKITGPPQRVTTRFDGNTVAPIWSPDGSKLAWFISEPPDPAAVADSPLQRWFVRDLATGAEFEVRPQIPLRRRPAPSWLTGDLGIMAGWNAPAGQGPGGAVYRIDPSSGAAHIVHSFESRVRSDPGWSGDGSRLYESPDTEPVITVKVVGEPSREVFRKTGAGAIRDTVPSPDGKLLAYVSMQGALIHPIMLLDLATGQSRELVSDVRTAWGGVP